MEVNKIHHIEARAGLQQMESESVQCCVTSPPYWGLRDYGLEKTLWPAVTYSLFGFEITVPKMECCLGLEEKPEWFIGHLISIFREVNRTLKKDGTMWLNIGDSYAAYWGDKYGQAQSLTGSRKNIGNAPPSKPSMDFSKSKRIERGSGRWGGGNNPAGGDIKPKCLVGIPWMLAFALRADGWYLRQDIIWHKPNPMPESVTDRCTKSHEYIFLLSKSQKYYYDNEAIKMPFADSSYQRLRQDLLNQNGSNRVPGKTNGNMKAVKFGGNKAEGYGTRIHSGKEWNPKAYKHRGDGDKKLTGHSGNFDAAGNLIGDGFANKRSVWTVTTKPFSEAHFATFPEDLIIDCIKAGCPENEIVLDPFMGAGTTALVAAKLNRNFIGFELNDQYISIANKRLKKELGMFHP